MQKGRYDEVSILENAMRLIVFFFGVLTSGCAIIPAHTVPQPGQSGVPPKIERPAVGFFPFGEDGGQFRLKYSPRDQRIGIEFRKKF